MLSDEELDHIKKLLDDLWDSPWLPFYFNNNLKSIDSPEGNEIVSMIFSWWDEDLPILDIGESALEFICNASEWIKKLLEEVTDYRLRYPTVNRMRTLLGLPPLEDGDRVLGEYKGEYRGLYE